MTLLNVRICQTAYWNSTWKWGSYQRIELKRKPKCSECNEEIKSIDVVKDHIARAHDGKRPLECPTCKVAVTTKI